MKRALRDKWAAALEGGMFTQGTGCLRSWDNKTCCLGVLADVFNPDLWNTDDSDELRNYGYAGDNKGELPDNILDEIGLTKKQQNQFITMNDDHGMSFEQIAQRVRELPVEDDKPKHRKASHRY